MYDFQLKVTSHAKREKSKQTKKQSEEIMQGSGSAWNMADNLELSDLELKRKNHH